MRPPSPRTFRRRVARSARASAESRPESPPRELARPGSAALPRPTRPSLPLLRDPRCIDHVDRGALDPVWRGQRDEMLFVSLGPIAPPTELTHKGRQKIKGHSRLSKVECREFALQNTTCVWGLLLYCGPQDLRRLGLLGPVLGTRAIQARPILLP